MMLLVVFIDYSIRSKTDCFGASTEEICGRCIELY